MPNRRSPVAISPTAVGPIAAVAVCVLFAAALLPSLGRLDFFDGVEHFNLATVQEMRRNEAEHVPVNWMLPTLQGEARVVKPPLTAWITAALVRPEHVAAIDTPDEHDRNQAIERFVAVCRLPTLACTCLMLLGVYVLGRALGTGDWRIGATAALMCAGTAIFFQQGRRATTDLQLALWVTWTNALLATAVFRGRRWIGYAGGGAALGLASMAKGPHIALLMTVVPLLVFGLYTWWMRRPLSEAHERPSTTPHGAQALARGAKASRWMPIVLGAILATTIGLWWYAYVAGTVPNIWDIWWREILRKDAQVGRNVMNPDPWYTYSSFFALLLPWTGWIVVGVAMTIREVTRSRTRARDSRDGERSHGHEDMTVPLEPETTFRAPLLSLLWLLLPILVMSFFAEKKERYLLPFVGPAAVLGAWALVRWWDERKAGGTDNKTRRTETDAERPSSDPSTSPVLGYATFPTTRRSWRQFDHRLGIVAGVFTFGAAAWLSLSVAVAGAMGLKGYRTAADQPWFSTQSAMMIGAATLCILVMGVLRSTKTLLPALLAITVVAWLGGEMKLRGLAASLGDNDDRPQRQLAADIWQRWPDAIVYSADPVTQYGQLNRPAIVLSMHLDRVIHARPATLPEKPQREQLVLITDSVGTVPAVPQGWRRIKEVPLRKGTRYVDVLGR